MSTSNIMHCRHCQKYIGNKINLDEYFFWCNKECYEANEKEIRDRNLDSMRTHDSSYKDKPKTKMTGSLDSEGNIIDSVIDKASKEQQAQKPTKKTRTNTKTK